jgi:hypothetical protein
MRKGLLIALAACLPAIVSANVLTTTITTTIPTIDDYLVFLGCTVALPSCTPVSAGAVSGVDLIGAVVPAVTNASLQRTIPNNIISGYVAAFGLDTTGSHVVVGLSNSISITTNAWSDIFPSTAESQIITDLATHSGATLADLTSFFDANLTDFVPFNGISTITGQIGEFSNGIVVGSISTNLQTIPEPSTLALTGLILAGLVVLRRWRLSHTS